MSLFQKDYYSMKDETLMTLAAKYRIATHALPDGMTDLGNAYFNRPRVINDLMARDSAMRTRATTILSLIAILLSLASFIKSLFLI